LLHPYTPKKCMEVLQILEKEGYICGWTEWNKKDENIRNKEQDKKSYVKVILKYNGHGKSAIQGIYRISKPGCNVYVSTSALWKPKSGVGVLILSTPVGVITDRDARLYNVGGELICGVF
jgi:small subunit ribosomal protein S8